MPQVMSRVNTPARLFGWLVLFATAFLAADLVSAGFDRSMQSDPVPFQAAAAAPTAAPRDAQVVDGLQVVLRQPAPETAVPTTNPAGGPQGGPGSAAPALGPPTGMALRGTLLAGAASVAFVDTNGQTQAVGIGDELGGFRVNRIESTWIGLQRGEQAFELVLDSMKPPGGSGASAPPPVSMGDAATVPAPPAPLPAPADAEAPVEGGQLSLEDIRAQLDNASKMAQQVRVVPKAKDGQTYGVQLEFRQPDNLMARLGLQHGDVLTGINGQPIRGAEDLYKAYMTMRNAEALQFQVERNGQTVPIQYQLAK